MMFEVDHIPVWTPDRDVALGALSGATGLPILNGFAPEGRRVARGVRFANGPFIDVHQADSDGPLFLGLSGDVAAFEALAAARGWRAKVAPRRDGPDAEPWSIAYPGRGQGLLSHLFIINYARELDTWTSPVFDGGLYHQPPQGGVSLSRVWLSAADLKQADADLRALGFAPAGEVWSTRTPGFGQLYRAGRCDLVLVEGEDAVVRFDVPTDGELVVLAIGPRLIAVVGRDSQEG